MVIPKNRFKIYPVNKRIIMYSRIVLVILIACSFGMADLSAQDNDPVLFTVEGNPVTVSEFNYIYSKTNGDKADYSKASVMEYLDLYKKFKLKVQKAKDLELHKVPALQNELAGYRKQLSNSYLMDRELTEKLVKEAYDRSKFDVNISHILVSVNKKSDPAEDKKALDKINKIHKKLTGGSKFESVAKEMSSDPAAKQSGGKIGYFTALQLPNFYALETAAYNTPVGQFSAPVKSALGYHIVKVNEKRPARGQVKAAHILARVPKNGGDAEAKAKIEAIQARLKKGENFEAIAKTDSDDKKTGRKGGEVGYFSINTYDEAFEDAAFNLKKDGDFSTPFRTSLGWHIIKRIEKKEMPEYELAKSGLLVKVKKDERFKVAKRAMIDNIKTTSNFKENSGTMNTFLGTLNQEFLSPKWVPSKAADAKELFKFGATSVTMGQFNKYLKQNQNLRFRKARGNTPEGVAKEMYAEFVEEQAIKYEEGQLEKKYPEFKALMREYEEGILLFEATKQLVWDKASEDTTGLRNFYNGNSSKYTWNPRAKASIISVKSDNEKIIAKTKKLAGKKSPEVLMAKMNKTGDIVSIKTDVYEQGRNSTVDATDWKVGAVGKSTAKQGVTSFAKINEILPVSTKTLKEARGYVVADYQDHLEKQWVDELKKTYTVVVDEKVLSSIIK